MSLVGGHLSRLADVGGRENRQPFWLWVLIVYAAMMVVSMVVMIPMMAGAVGSMGATASGDPAYLNAHPEIMQQAMMRAFVPMFRNLFTLSTATSLVAAGLIGAATVRRLHDGDRSGWWALPPLLLQLATLASYQAVFPRFFDVFARMRPGMTPDQMNLVMASAMQSTAWVSLLGMVNLLALVLLVVFLALPGTEGANRFGDDPLGRVPGVSSWRRPPTSHP